MWKAEKHAVRYIVNSLAWAENYEHNPSVLTHYTDPAPRSGQQFLTVLLRSGPEAPEKAEKCESADKDCATWGIKTEKSGCEELRALLL